MEWNTVLELLRTSPHVGLILIILYLIFGKKVKEGVNVAQGMIKEAIGGGITQAIEPIVTSMLDMHRKLDRLLDLHDTNNFPDPPEPPANGGPPQ